MPALKCYWCDELKHQHTCNEGPYEIDDCDEVYKFKMLKMVMPYIEVKCVKVLGECKWFIYYYLFYYILYN